MRRRREVFESMGIGGLRHRGPIAEIDAQGVVTPIRSAFEAFENLSETVGVPADQADPGPRGGETLRDGPSDALRAAADDGAATVE